MRERPAVRARVLLLGNTDLPGVAGRTARVVAHHVDGIAFKVRLDRVVLFGRRRVRHITVDPINVRPIAVER